MRLLFTLLTMLVSVVAREPALPKCVLVDGVFVGTFVGYAAKILTLKVNGKLVRVWAPFLMREPMLNQPVQVKRRIVEYITDATTVYPEEIWCGGHMIFSDEAVLFV